MADVLDRIRKLIALAESPNENEARNAAFLAVKMIRENKVHLSLTAPRARKDPGPIGNPFEDFFTYQRPRQPRPPPPRRERPPPPPPQGEPKVDAYGKTWMFFRFCPVDDNCTYCGRLIYRGDPVYALADDSRQHERCWRMSKAPKPQDFDISAEELDELFRK